MDIEAKRASSSNMPLDYRGPERSAEPPRNGVVALVLAVVLTIALIPIVFLLAMLFFG